MQESPLFRVRSQNCKNKLGSTFLSLIVFLGQVPVQPGVHALEGEAAHQQDGSGQPVVCHRCPGHLHDDHGS